MKEAFLKKLRELDCLGLRTAQYLIWGSGPLAIREIREARDVDILVSKALWNELACKHVVQGTKQNLIEVGGVEVWSDCMNLTSVIDEMIEECDLIEGYPFMKLSYMIQWKAFLNREKDLSDIALIEAYYEQAK